MHPYVIEHMVQERQAELHRLASAGRGARATRAPWIGRRRDKADRPAAAPATELTPACCPG